MDNKITIYHGSKFIIEKPTLRGGKETNDYGYGFYCTKEIELAKEWACPDNNDGYANEYLLDLNGLKVLDLSNKKYNILNWIALLLQYRIPKGLNPNDEQAREYVVKNFTLNLTDVDVIIGYRADDSYFSFARDFVKNNITVKQLSKAMDLGALGIQVVLHSEKAFNQLTYVKSSIAENETYYTKRVARDLQAREDYQKTTRNIKVDKDDLFIMDIIRQEVKNDDARIQRNILK
ncbi:MAG: DUF3990 domain-containing protein [Clostridiales bacterium]|nr:DUF3990 domain-containing protein [Clostridiales bacterium]